MCTVGVWTRIKRFHITNNIFYTSQMEILSSGRCIGIRWMCAAAICCPQYASDRQIDNVGTGFSCNGSWSIKAQIIIACTAFSERIDFIRAQYVTCICRYSRYYISTASPLITHKSWKCISCFQYFSTTQTFDTQSKRNLFQYQFEKSCFTICFFFSLYCFVILVIL